MGQLEQREVVVQRGHKLTGQSGYEYDTTMFIPKHEAVVEPIVSSPRARNRARTVYVEFADLANVNSYKPVSLVDDVITNSTVRPGRFCRK